jgi:hypothetical protein
MGFKAANLVEGPSGRISDNFGAISSTAKVALVRRRNHPALQPVELGRDREFWFPDTALQQLRQHYPFYEQSIHGQI